MLLLRGATGFPLLNYTKKGVSIHAPLARSNLMTLSPESPVVSFNTCSSCEEQLALKTPGTFSHTFQYMLLLRGATRLSKPCLFWRCFNTCSSCEEQRRRLRWRAMRRSGFNTCSSCEEQRKRNSQKLKGYQVSIHAPLARSNFGKRPCPCHFPVSIHAPLARSNCHARKGDCD